MLNQYAYAMNGHVQPGSVRVGRTMINFVHQPEDLSGFQQELDHVFAEGTHYITLQQGNQTHHISTELPEYIAAKLTGGKIRDKDQYDITVLTYIGQETGQPINTAHLETILTRLGSKTRMHDYKNITGSYAP